MLKKEDIKEILLLSLKSGADFAELYFEDTVHDEIEMLLGEVKSLNTVNIYGVGIRVIKDLEEVYAYTSDLSIDNLKRIATQLSTSFEGEVIIDDINFQKPLSKDLHKRKVAYDNHQEEIVEFLKKSANVAINYDKRIVQVSNTFTYVNQKITIYNSNGLIANDERNNIRFGISVIAKEGDNMQNISERYGKNQGIEALDLIDIEEFSLDVAKSAITMLSAKDMIGQTLPVIIHNRFGGVILHEACGHSLEATAVAKDLSVFSGKKGEKIASDLVTAIDDGTLENAWGSLNYDDEGNETSRNLLIDKGTLNSYIVDMKNDRIMNHGVTGSTRRQSYKFSPTSRMTNTFIDNGESTFDEIIKNTKYGFFAKRMGGGSVNPTTGEFNFIVMEGYMVEDGKITDPIKGATLIGNGKDCLMAVDMVGNNLDFAPGMCGSLSGSIPADVGQPTIRLSKMLVGGKGGN